MFYRISIGDKLLLMDDEKQGLTMIKLSGFLAATAEIMKIIKETNGNVRRITESGIVLIWAAVVTVIAVVVFKKKMRY